MAQPQQAVATQCQLRDQVLAQGAGPNDYGGSADVQFDSPASLSRHTWSQLFVRCLGGTGSCDTWQQMLVARLV